jgi:hypothetical protein
VKRLRRIEAAAPAADARLLLRPAREYAFARASPPRSSPMGRLCLLACGSGPACPSPPAASRVGCQKDGSQPRGRLRLRARGGEGPAPLSAPSPRRKSCAEKQGGCAAQLTTHTHKRQVSAVITTTHTHNRQVSAVLARATLRTRRHQNRQRGPRGKKVAAARRMRERAPTERRAKRIKASCRTRRLLPFPVARFIRSAAAFQKADW